MKLVAMRESQGGHPATPRINVSTTQYSTDGISVSIEVKITPVGPVCAHCGHTKVRVIGAFWICPNCDPDPAAAIPLRGEKKEVIDIEPDEARRAA